jgi:hypothetical protein
MFRSSYLKLYRKLLILCVITAGVFVLSANVRVSAVPCCNACEPAYDECLTWCSGEEWKPQFYSYCVATYCEPAYYTCGQEHFCEIEAGVFGCQH